jgi:hypothetical protein
MLERTLVVLVIAGLAASLACTGEGGSTCGGGSTSRPDPYDLVVQLAESATVPCNGIADASATADAEPDAGPVCYASCPTSQCPPPSVYLTYLVGCTMTTSDAGPDVAAAVCHYQADPVDIACG